MNIKEKYGASTANAAVAVGVTLAVLFLIACVVFGPVLAIASINALFPALAIPYNIYTWAAVVFLYVFSKSSVSFKK